MAQIPVSINRTGDITISDITVAAGETVTWWVNGGTVTSITPGDPSPFRANPTQANGVWTAVVISSGTYTITDSLGKKRTPRINIVTPAMVK